MKMWKKLITSVVTAGLLTGLLAGSVYAEKTSYQYTVTFSAGVRGSFSGTAGLSLNSAGGSVTQDGGVIKITGLAAGDTVSFNAQSSVSLGSDSKYYVQGVRESGRDNDTVAASVFKVEEDADYVVAYGIKGNMTSYTVHYQDEAGNTLAETDTFYGNVGDKPVIAYKYVDGYVPQVLGYTKTLSDNEAENVITFVYDKIPGPTVNTVTQTVPGSTGTTGTGTAGTTGTGTAAGDDTVEGTTPGATTGPDGAEGTTGEPGTVTEGTEPEGTAEAVEGTSEPAATEEAAEAEESEIVDLDDEEVPLAGDLDVDDSSKESAVPMVGIVSLTVVAVAALGLIVFFVKKRGLR